MVRAKKSLGQNFLTSQKIARDIVQAAKVDEEDTVLEIGPGKGMLTTELLATGANVVAIEKDAELIPILQEKFTEEIKSNQLKLIEGDALTVCNRITNSYKLVANIPYYITGQIIRRFLTSENHPISMTLLVQKEVAQRIVGTVCNPITNSCKESILSLSVKTYGVPKYVAKVPARFFNPKPKVDSAILHIADISKDLFNNEISEENFFKIVRAGFAQKRKKLVNNLAVLVPKEEVLNIFKNLNIEENIRAEDVPLGKWRSIAKNLASSSIVPER